MFDLEKQDKYQMREGKWKTEISPFALKWIEIHLNEIKRKYKRKTRLMEFGAGLSTVWYGKNLPDTEICTVEGDEKWYERVKARLKKEKVKNVKLKYVPQDANYRLPYVHVNSDYVYPFAVRTGWDVIINDGAIRETIGDTTMECADTLIRPNGVYLRHDYEKAARGDWLQTGWEKLGYEEFCAENDSYGVITIPGNGIWGYLAELGGIWRKPN